MRTGLKAMLIGCAVLVTLAVVATAIPITVDGKFTDWQMVKAIAQDKNEGLEPCDWLQVYATHDALYWYIRYICTDVVNYDVGAAYNVYLDVDRNRMTGYRGSGDDFPLGAEYLIQAGTLYVYDGNGMTWKWDKKATLAYGVEQNSAEVSIPRAMIGNPDRLFFFLYGDNHAAAGAKEDILPDNAINVSGTGGTLRYSFQGAN
jgi:hypothetical protein